MKQPYDARRLHRAADSVRDGWPEDVPRDMMVFALELAASHAEQAASERTPAPGSPLCSERWPPSLRAYCLVPLSTTKDGYADVVLNALEAADDLDFESLTVDRSLTETCTP